MKFSQYHDNVSKMFEDSPPLIKYRVLSDYIKNMVPHRCATQSLEEDILAGEECKLCNEPWTLGPGMITTKCRHSFHPTCLIHYLNSGHSSRSCPLCGCSVQKFMPLGFDGSILQFHAMVQININAVESYHTFISDDLRRKFTLITQSMRRFEDRVRVGETRGVLDLEFVQDLKSTGSMLLHQIELAEMYGRVCYEAVQKILKKFDKHTTLEISPSLLQAVRSLRFFGDCCRPGQGDLDAMRRELLGIFSSSPDITEEPDRSLASPPLPLDDHHFHCGYRALHCEPAPAPSYQSSVQPEQLIGPPPPCVGAPS